MGAPKPFKIFQSGQSDVGAPIFRENRAIIGDSPDSPHAFALAGRGLKKEQISIVQEGDLFIIHNIANDPFCLVNGEPFYKRRIKGKATLSIRGLDLVIQEIHELDSPQEETHYESPPPKKRDPAVVSSPKPMPAPDLHKEEPTPFTHSESRIETPKRKREIKIPWKPWLSFIIVFSIFIIGVISIERYLRLFVDSEREELEAATLLADIAMAFTNAQLYHVTPEKYDWSDPTFVKQNLIALLDNPPKLRIDEGGLLVGASYRIRIYTSQDLSRFLLLATPSPTLLQWLIPKKSLALDSASMNIRKLLDVTTLNRLLAPMTTLDGVNGYYVNKVLAQGEVISLYTIAKSLQRSDFSPPSALTYIRPGADSLIYNAPRYHAFGEALLEKGGQFSSVITSSHEMLMLRSELEVLKKLPHLMLYTKAPLEKAKQAFNTLKRISPENDFILARLFTKKSGDIRSIEIILDTTPQEEALPTSPPIPRILLAQALSITPPFTPMPESLYVIEEPIIALNREEAPSQRDLLKERFQQFLETPSEEFFQSFLTELAHFKENSIPKGPEHQKRSSFFEQYIPFRSGSFYDIFFPIPTRIP